MSAKSAKNRTSQLTPTASTPEGELQKHLSALGLDSPAAYRVWCREQGFGSALDKPWQERRREVQRAQKLAEEAKTAYALREHYWRLGFEREQEYAVWCDRHGFAPTGSKTPAQRKQELALRERERADEAVRKVRSQERKPEETLTALYKGQVRSRDLRTPALLAVQRAFALPNENPLTRRAFLQLLLTVQQHTDLIDCEPVIEGLGRQEGNTYIEALLALARHTLLWRRTLDTWRPTTHNAFRQFASLARHLMADYPVPVFMDAAWFEGATQAARRHQKWFRHIGIGQNIRTAGLPIPLTSRAAHLFLQAPADLPIEAALRWGQLQALGAEERLCRAVIATRLGSAQPYEAFWTSVLHFFVNNPMLDPDQIGPIVDFLHNRRFVMLRTVGPDGVPKYAVPEPEFSMKGRTVPALLRRVEEWHRTLHRETRKVALEWEPRPDIAPFATTQADPITGQTLYWSVEELTNGRALHQEGKAMRHCVASYARSCARGICSIWSLRVRTGIEETPRRVMTIEVRNHQRAIVQARGACNKTATARHAGFWLKEAPDVLKLWATQEKLKVATVL